MKRKFVVAGVAAVAAAGLMLEATAQVKPEILVKQRQAAMTLQGKYFGPLGGMAQGKVPYDADVVRRNAAYLEVLTKLPWDGFDPSTRNEKSAALPAVFTDTAKFKEASERLQNEVAKLVAVSKSGDEGAVKAQIGAVGKACGSCHESFREKR
jgi:cytochrome c556